jgi:hypothetical protein
MTSRLRDSKSGFGTRLLAGVFTWLGLAVVTVLSGCHSSHIEVAVENRTGAPIRLLEVDYPSASFGSDALQDGATFHYRIQVQGNGQLKVQYVSGDGHQTQINGPALAERQEGNLEVKLLPGGKAEFRPHMSGPSAP